MVIQDRRPLDDIETPTGFVVSATTYNTPGRDQYGYLEPHDESITHQVAGQAD